MKNNATAVIIGGGVIGAAVAYELATRGMKDIILLEKSTLFSGATARCGAGVRQQWGTEMNLRLSIGSVKRYETLSEELDYKHGIEFSQSGYFMPAYTEKQIEQFQKNLELQRKFGLDVHFLKPNECRSVVPIVSLDGLLGATYYDKDGYLSPFHTTAAYAEAAKRKGVDIELYTEVIGFDVNDQKITRVQTNKGYIDCDYVVNAAGGWSQEIAKMAGVSLPLVSERHQILITEPIEPLFRPMVMSFYHGFYTQQEPNGAIIMGVGDPNEPKGYNMEHSFHFLHNVTKLVTQVLPAVGKARVLRQWSGLYNLSPDRTPILGTPSEINNMYLTVGFSGHGFMIAPMVATLTAQMITNEELLIPEVETKLDIGRFQRGELFVEPSVV
ncbi:MAG: FAD-binding oxidoreductase [Caldisericia bacterium]|nr:FAD-binding oxidoreductase [Caldisericia bacterium]